ncbi:hypothetical protein DOT_4355, partial [Desulfosporosinus sp. OT]
VVTLARGLDNGTTAHGQGRQQLQCWKVMTGLIVRGAMGLVAIKRHYDSTSCTQAINL